LYRRKQQLRDFFNTHRILQQLPGEDGFAIDGFQASLLIKLEKLDWGSILDNESDGHAR